MPASSYTIILELLGEIIMQKHGNWTKESSKAICPSLRRSIDLFEVCRTFHFDFTARSESSAPLETGNRKDAALPGRALSSKSRSDVRIEKFAFFAILSFKLAIDTPLGLFVFVPFPPFSPLFQRTLCFVFHRPPRAS